VTRLRGAELSSGKIFILREVWSFSRVRKKWWLAPIVVLLLTLGLILIVTEGAFHLQFVLIRGEMPPQE
jgi:hypothetical protein